ncbi:MAG: M28 family peptidase [Solirubrobacteraceae bacterium]|nr:M28 family peptidase [Solirubrobacteraceae bacterium]
MATRAAPPRTSAPDPELLAELEHAVRHLAAIDRPSASEGETQAALWIAGALRDIGLEAQLEAERAHGTYWWPIGLLNGFSLLALGLAGRGRRRLARLLAGSALVLLVEDLDHRRRWFRRAALPHRPTHNVVAVAGDPDATRTLVVVAHHDAAHSGAIFDPGLPRLLQARFPKQYEKTIFHPPVMWLTVMGPLLATWHALFGGRRSRRVARIFAVGTILGMLDIGSRAAVPGANDNLTGVAVLLGLARRLRDEPVSGLRVLLVSAGSEESNSEGMAAFGRRHFRDLPRDATWVIAVDSVGSPTLCAPISEGFLRPYDYDDPLRRIAVATAAEHGIEIHDDFRFSFATDAQIAMHAGYRSMMLGSVDELRSPSNYHWPTDTAENVDYGTVVQAVTVVEGIARKLA